ncbi:hypothetical protein RB653_008140 [Dictyostelium firmibasis]|uniref:Dickkopf N-terminal cysteine-rich domain-containing protein n=1 Tax=Dictyostelium firmibasis TaxID=79012 RepID=A0AAN7TS48_9MYCE
MKYLILLIILTFIPLIKSYCVSCINPGEKCRIVGIEGECSNGFVCATNVKNGNNLNYTCQPRIKINQNCFDDNTCEFGLICDGDICKDTKFSNIGQECSMDSDCSSKKAKCSGGVCKNMEGTCDYDGDCPKNQQCSDHLCYDFKTQGQICTVGGISCIDDLECYSSNKTNGEIGVCEKINKKALGQNCSDSYQCNGSDNLYCSNNICEKYIITNQSCSSGSECDEFHSCGCDGKCYLTSLPIIPNYDTFTECFQTKCGGIFPENEFSSKSCLAKNCAKEICNYFSSSSKSPFEFKCNQIQSQVDYLCGLAKSDSIKLKFSILSIAISFIIALIL